MAKRTNKVTTTKTRKTNTRLETLKRNTKKTDNSPEAVAERYGGLVREPEVREADPVNVKLDDKGVEIGRGDMCPLCAGTTNAHREGCGMLDGATWHLVSLEDEQNALRENATGNGS